ncbi:23S rRNA (uracil(1939)-C(5))-methyltransferase RlmD [Gordonibacter sp. Marseille-P4307]|uniref:23S rRNA (uracil(1939)-C(5))-methyltransferase RlmD n=1 Tax=Gordonibacter sp. Marseille-P4307 TaxID=2161815 RepID=UPI001F14E515|nr:23S rRNA (uracil(1939)-C(5))-methyltransferase RlmD [Gordonibacter sp. Marseille-P4307]
MDEPYRYRNKVMSPFAAGRRQGGAALKGGFAKDGRVFGKGAARRKGPLREILTGMYAAGTHRIVDTRHCLVENEQAQKVVRSVKTLMMRYGIEPYDEDAGTGFMRHVVVRVGHESGEMLVTLVTNSEEFPASRSFCRELTRMCPFITTVVQNVNLRKTNVVLGGKEQRLYGPGFILDTLCGLSFRISSQSFYQVNSVQTEILYLSAIGFAQLDGTQSVIDAYCGTGTIGLVAASRGASSVVGVDTVESSIRDARENARHNGIENAAFHAADASSFMRGLAAEGRSADVVFMDPPRAGSTEEFLDALAVLAPRRVVYISCNPVTQMRDLRYLAAKGYRVEKVQGVDMFPHTDHIETVALLSKLNTEHHLDIEIGEDELSEIDFSKDATYGEIKKYVLDKYGLKVSSLYIAQIKRKHGLIERENYNFSKKENQRVPNCPEEKEKAIEDALEHFGMI